MREIAISMRTLWSTFNAFSVGEKTNMALYRLWLKRTCGAPLVINFDKFYIYKEFDTALTLFFSHSFQWADVEILLQPLTYAKLLELRPEDVPLLKKIHIVGEDCQYTKNDANQIISTLARIPTLSDLTWSFNIPAQISPLTWPNLRKFTTGMALKTTECLALLSCLSQIEDIDFGYHKHSPIDVASCALTVESLCSLSLDGDDPADFFDALTLPSLNSLRLPRPKDSSSLERLIDRSGCTLRHLTISAMITEYGRHLRELNSFLELKCFHSIYSLRLTYTQYMTNQVARRLTWDIDSDYSTQIFPYLTTINVERCVSIDGLFTRMILSRWKGRHHPYGLKRVELQPVFWGWNYRKTDYAVLNGLRDQGLEIVQVID